MISASGSYDVVILGSGIAGLAAAMAADALGLEPVVLEKAGTLGGGTVHSYGLIWVGQNHLAEAAGHRDTGDEVLAYMRFLGGGNIDEGRLSAFVDRSPEALKFFENCGVRFRLVGGVTDHYYDEAPGSHAVGRCVEAELISGFDLGAWRDRVSVPHDVPCFVTAEEQIAWGGVNSASRWDAGLVRERKQRDMRGKGLGLICHFLKALLDRGVPVLTNRGVANLAVENGRAIGVVMNSGEFVAARKGVVLATGGYGANRQMSRDFEQLPLRPRGVGLDAGILDGRRNRPRRGDRRDRAPDREQPAGDAVLHHSAGAAGWDGDLRLCRHRRIVQPAYALGEQVWKALCR